MSIISHSGFEYKKTNDLLNKWKCYRCGHTEVHDNKVVKLRCKCGYYKQWEELGVFECEDWRKE